MTKPVTSGIVTPMSTVDRPEAPPPLERLRVLRNDEDRLAQEKRAIITEARRQDRSWAEIAEALGISKQAAWELYNADVRDILDRTSRASGLTEDEAMKLAVEEVAEVRRERRRRSAS